MADENQSLELVHVYGSYLEARWNGLTMARYVYAPLVSQRESPKPFISPVRSLAGDVVTAYRPHDHPWHKGIQLALAHVDDDSFWGGPTYVPGRLRSDEDEYPEGYVQLPNNGSMIHESFDRIEASGPIMAIDERLEWLTQSGTHVVDEQRSIQWDFTPAAEGAWILRFRTTITNALPRPVIFSSPTVLGGPAGYGGLAWRGTRSFTGGDIMTSGARTGPELMGIEAPWVGFSGRHDENEHSSTIVFVDDRGNTVHPTKWFVLSQPYATICSAPFWDKPYALPPSASLTLGYKVVITSTAWDARAVEGFLTSYQLGE